MSGDYASDRAWSDKYIPAIQTIIGAKFVPIAPREADLKQATDLLLFEGPKSLAARVRRGGFDTADYQHEFTIRESRANGTETELSKILGGFGDLMFYGHASELAFGISRYMIIDLHKLRAAFAEFDADLKAGRTMWARQIGQTKRNRDNTTSFRAINITHPYLQRQPGILVATSHPQDYASLPLAA